MKILYDDLEGVYKRISGYLETLSEKDLENTKKQELAAWIKASLTELSVHLQATIENRLYEKKVLE